MGTLILKIHQDPKLNEITDQKITILKLEKENLSLKNEQLKEELAQNARRVKIATSEETNRIARRRREH